MCGNPPLWRCHSFTFQKVAFPVSALYISDFFFDVLHIKDQVKLVKPYNIHNFLMASINYRKSNCLLI